MARNADPLRTGKSRSHRDRKNGSAHEAWLRRKSEANEARGPQEVTLNVFEIGETRIEKFKRSRT